jgi:sugar lactone lactonase YvrE
MSIINFPSNPVNNQTLVVNSKTFIFDSFKSAWRVVQPTGGDGETVFISVSSLNVDNSNRTAFDTAGGEVITVSGQGFQTNSYILIGNTIVNNLTINSSSSLSFTTPPKNEGIYNLIIVNPDDTAVQFQVIYANPPVWEDAINELIIKPNQQISTFLSIRQITTNDPSIPIGISYSLISGSTLPSGLVLQSSGEIVGSTSFTGNQNFTVRAINQYGQGTNKEFTIISRNVSGDVAFIQYPTTIKDSSININFSASEPLNRFGLVDNRENWSGMTFSPDGRNLYLTNTPTSTTDAAIGFVTQLTLATPWDLTTAQVTVPYINLGKANDIYIDDTGTRLFVTVFREIRKYTLITPWLVSSAVLDQTVDLLTASGGILSGTVGDGTNFISFNDQGTILFTHTYRSSSAPTVRFDLLTPWDLTTLTVAQSSTNTAFAPLFKLSKDGLRVYGTDGGRPIVRRLFTSPFNISTFTSTTNQRYVVNFFDNFDIWRPRNVSMLVNGGTVTIEVFTLAFVATRTANNKGAGLYINEDRNQLFGAGGRYINRADMNFNFTNSSSAASPTQQIVDVKNCVKISDVFTADNLLFISQESIIVKYQVSDFNNLILSDNVLQFVNFDDHRTDSFDFSLGGRLLFVLDRERKEIIKYRLSTVYDLSSCEFVESKFFKNLENIGQIKVSNDGSFLFVRHNNILSRFTLNFKFDLSSADTVLNYTFIGMNSFELSDDGEYLTVLYSNSFIKYRLSSSYNLDNSSIFANRPTQSGPFTSIRDNKQGGYFITTSSNIQSYQSAALMPLVRSPFISELTVDTAKTGVTFSPDGTQMFVVGSAQDRIVKFNLNTPWETSTAYFVQSSSILEGTVPADVFIANDGIDFYIIESGLDRIFRYQASVAYDLTTLTLVSDISIVAQESTPTASFFSPDGLIMYILGSSSDRVHRYNLTTAWDITTASFVNNFLVSAQENTPSGLYFTADGLAMFICGTGQDNIIKYTLTTPWDLTTAGLNSTSPVTALNPTGLFFKPDGMKFFITVGSRVWSYDLTNPWDVTSFTLDFEFISAVSLIETTPTGIRLKPDGTSLFIIGSISDKIVEYTMTIPWDVTTARFKQDSVFSIQSIDTTPSGFYIKPDGLSVYITGTVTASVYHFTTNIAWNFKNLQPVTSFSFASQDATQVRDVYFKPDGTKMYMAGDSANRIYEYSLSTAWDITTATFMHSVLAGDSSPHDMVFNSDGTKMYVMGGSANVFVQHTLATPWDISTSSIEKLSGRLLPLSETAHRGLDIQPDGSSIFAVGNINSAVYQYKIF